MTIRLVRSFFLHPLYLSYAALALAGCTDDGSSPHSDAGSLAVGGSGGAGGMSGHSWEPELAAEPTGAVVIGSTSYDSCSKLLVSWGAPDREVSHYVLSATDQVVHQSVEYEIPAPASSSTVKNLKSGTSYELSIKACLDGVCTNVLTAEDLVTARTAEEVWQLQGSVAQESFTAMTVVASESNTKAYVVGYGAGAPANLLGKARLYYDGTTAKGINVALSDSTVGLSPSTADSFTPLGSSFGIFSPPVATPYISVEGAGEGVATFQAIPLAAEMGGGIRLMFEASGTDGKMRVLQLDSQDGYVGADFNSTTATVCSTAADYTSGGCVPTVAIGVAGDGLADSGLDHVRQSKVGYPRRDNWLWQGSEGTFIVVTAERSCGSPANGLAYGLWDGSNWSLVESSGCPQYLVDDAHGPVVVHRSGAAYKLYYEDASNGNQDKPLRLLYGDGLYSGELTNVDFADWEPPSDARQVHFLWPSGTPLTTASESGLGDHVIFLPTGELDVQFMYVNLGGLDDSSWLAPSVGIGLAMLVNP